MLNYKIYKFRREFEKAIATVLCKTKKLRVWERTKIVFWGTIKTEIALFKYFGLEFEETIVIFEIRTSKGNKIKFETEMFYLGIFGLEFNNIIDIFEMSTLEFIKNEFLTNIINLVIGSAFSKGPGSTFSEVPSPGPNLLCKVYCLLSSFFN